MAADQDQGLTLVELLAVLLIIGILAGVSTLSFGTARKTSLSNSCGTVLKAFDLAVTAYQTDNKGALPTLQSQLSPNYLPKSVVDQLNAETNYKVTYEYIAGPPESYQLKITNSASVVVADCKSLT